MTIEPPVQWGAVERGDPLAALEQLGSHTAGTGPEFQPMPAGGQGRAVEEKIVQGFRYFGSGAADGAIGVLADKQGTTREKTVAGTGGLQPGKEALFSRKAEEGRLVRILGIGWSRT